MFGYPIRSSFSLIKLLSGLSKTLNVANQIIPVYKKAKPIINNAKDIVGTLKSINLSNNDIKENKKELPSSSLSNKPQFFI